MNAQCRTQESTRDLYARARMLATYWVAEDMDAEYRLTCAGLVPEASFRRRVQAYLRGEGWKSDMSTLVEQA